MYALQQKSQLVNMEGSAIILDEMVTVRVSKDGQLIEMDRMREKYGDC